MTFRSASTKIRAVVHVGSLSGVVRRQNQPQDQLIHHNYELYGVALEVCRHIVTETSRLTESHIKVTKDAVDDGGRSACWESLTLVPDAACIVVSIFTIIMII